ncbi:S-adenosyl-L-methionine-dependent methyltransferase [Kockovaella imperatae]|uniref:Protein arginine methyltransferase NDUFAF7 n=1 Tax=Kockovaella imperatae TaxID=4999 RepID=A0A1Y1U8A9_9TREE|nr:S-adenosyl-L-methionine-dependent methyltransferase [Kockovaella imperatae]ORX34248.1 S-adenosyl-L-methionine-dependent methyltransferase [Kockovaella imperatae]
MSKPMSASFKPGNSWLRSCVASSSRLSVGSQPPPPPPHRYPALETSTRRSGRSIRYQSSSTEPSRRPPPLVSRSRKPKENTEVIRTEPEIKDGPGAPASVPPSAPKEKPRQDFNTSLSWLVLPDPDHMNYRRVTAQDLRNRREPPTRVKMLVREYIHDSLYNPHYGYFSKKATIFRSPPGGYDFSTFRDQTEFQEQVASRYAAEYGDMIEGSLGRQVWHTPTELFSPYYAQALVSGIITAHKSSAKSPSSPLIIYELGAGNGSFMSDALSFIRDQHPDLWPQTRYRVIEISPELARLQRERAKESKVDHKVEILNTDVFDWEGGDKEPCYVVALEMLDNLAHDMVRYDIQTLQPYQTLVTIDATGNFNLIYEPITDPTLSQAMSYYDRLSTSSTSSRRHTVPNIPSLIRSSTLLRKAYTELPFAPNLSSPDFIPSKAIALIKKLKEQLPNHRFLAADFATLPDTVSGRNGPVVQTRLGRVMVSVGTFLVKHGYFDIFFPTNFELLRDILALITKDLPSASIPGGGIPAIEITSQSDFVRKYGGSELTKKLTTRNGVSIMDAMYGNAKVMF